MNPTSEDENYNNDQVEDIVFKLMYQPILRKEGQWRRTESGEDMNSVQVYILIYKAKNNLNSSLTLGQWALKFCLPWASLGTFF